MEKNTLFFEFDDSEGKKQTLLFNQPIEVLTTEQIDQVVNVLKEAEAWLARGKYIAGFLSYEAAPAFEPRYHVKQKSVLPLAWFAVFDEPQELKSFPVNKGYNVSEWKLTSDYQTYHTGIDAIKAGIKRGDTYQVNYTTRLEATFKGDDFAFYQQLAKNQQASYSAYLNIGDFRILSASPELFFRVKDKKIITKPMKGTTKRGRTLKEDEQFAAYLKSSEKERAENLMIVDLLRNDIGKIAEKGSVNVPKLLTVEKYPTVNQMTSTITATLKDGVGLVDWMRALFPCGSITGAPKIKTMEYINQLEDTPREVYCGAIGFVTPNQEAVFNVPIRTVIIDQKQNIATYGVGGGITWDSKVTNEYEEVLTKAELLTTKRESFELLESLLLENQVYPLLDHHLTRLHDSATYYDYQLDDEKIKAALYRVAKGYAVGKYKVRLLVNQAGEVNVETEKLTDLNEPVFCAKATKPISSAWPSLYHKTTNRSIYKEHEGEHPDSFSVLLYNEDEEVTEFTIGNIVIEQEGKYYTPPLSCGLLPGTYRQHLLDQAKIKEKVIKLTDIATVDKIWLINSVRGWVEVLLR